MAVLCIVGSDPNTSDINPPSTSEDSDTPHVATKGASKGAGKKLHKGVGTVKPARGADRGMLERWCLTHAAHLLTRNAHLLTRNTHHMAQKKYTCMGP